MVKLEVVRNQNFNLCGQPYLSVQQFYLSSARYPFFTEMLWYTLDRYIHCLMGRTHLDLPEEEKRRMRLEKGDNIDTNKEVLKLVNPNADRLDQQQTQKPYLHLTQSELLGIKFIVMYLHHLPHSKKNVPIMLPDPVSVSITLFPDRTVFHRVRNKGGIYYQLRITLWGLFTLYLSGY